MFPPASVEVAIDAVAGIINLSSFDKQKIANKLRMDVITDSEIF